MASFIYNIAGPCRKMQTKTYEIDSQGFFKSKGGARDIVVEVADNYIPYSGDTLVCVYCTKGTIHVEVEGDVPAYHGAPTVRFFEGGLPLVGQYVAKVWVRKSSEDAQVYAVFENYSEHDRRDLAYYSAPYDQEYGVKLRDLRDGTCYQVVGRNGGTTPFLKRIEWGGSVSG